MTAAAWTAKRLSQSPAERSDLSRRRAVATAKSSISSSNPAFPPPTRSPTSPAAVSVWTWYASISKSSGDGSRSAPRRDRATFLLKLPLTLAIIDGLVVGVGQERYIVPLFAVREMFRPTAETIWTVQQRAEMAMVRGSLLPVVRLYRLSACGRAKTPGRRADGCRARGSDSA